VYKTQAVNRLICHSYHGAQLAYRSGGYGQQQTERETPPHPHRDWVSCVSAHHSHNSQPSYISGWLERRREATPLASPLHMELGAL
jgi:hypothetical protein